MKKLGILITILVIGTILFARDRYSTSSAGLVDGDYGDITVSGSGTAMSIDSGVITAGETDPCSAGLLGTHNATFDHNDIASAYQSANFNAGTDPNADLEEETHASEHAVGGGDTVFPADPDADTFLQWDDTNSVPVWKALADLFASSADTQEAVEDWVGAMLPSTLTYVDDSNNIKKEYVKSFCIPDPNYYYSNSTNKRFCFDPNSKYAITVTEVAVQLEADPTTEINANLKFADAYIGVANATLVVAIDTTNGVADIDSGFNDATVPAGKAWYIEFDAQPDANTEEMLVVIRGTYD